MSRNFEKIKHYFDLGLYTERHINKLFSVGAISAEERDSILVKEGGNENGN